MSEEMSELEAFDAWFFCPSNSLLSEWEEAAFEAFQAGAAYQRAQQPQSAEPDAITMADVMRAWEYAEDHPHKYLRGTTNWCAAVAHSLNQQRVAAPSAPKADDPVKQMLLEALEELMYAHTDKAEALAESAVAAARRGEGE